MADVKSAAKRVPAKKAVTAPREEGKNAKVLLDAVLKAVADAEKGGVRVKGTYTYPNEDGTVNNGSLK